MSNRIPKYYYGVANALFNQKISIYNHLNANTVVKLYKNNKEIYIPSIGVGDSSSLGAIQGTVEDITHIEILNKNKT